MMKSKVKRAKMIRREVVIVWFWRMGEMRRRWMEVLGLERLGDVEKAKGVGEAARFEDIDSMDNPDR